MVTKRTFSLPSSDGEHELNVVTWTPEGEPKGVVQISHGIAEHIERYDNYARVLAEAGYFVVGNDHLGHGKTARNPEELGYTTEKAGWFKMCADLEWVRRWVRESYPDLPYVLLGHSMGSFLARTYLIRYPGKVDGCILSGTGQESAAVINLGANLAHLAALRKGGKAHSPTLEQMMFGPYNRKFAPNRTGSDWISRDEAEVDRYLADPLSGFPVSVQLIQDMMCGLSYIWKEENLQKMEKTTPILLYSGDKDPVGGCGKGVKKVYHRLVDVGCQDVTMKLYPEGRHEMHNELNREQVFADVLEWLEEVPPPWQFAEELEPTSPEELES
jgi:alpha-beta hydrolase superfamily lysophospholipase